MAEALSQSQIDELLKAMQSGEAPNSADTGPKLKEYDFKSPKKFTKEQLKALDSLHENFSRSLSSYFTSILHSVCEMNVLQIEESRYYEFSNALPENTLMGVMELASEDPTVEDTTMLMNVSSNLSFLIIDRMLGGSEGVMVPDRTFTDIEMALLSGVLNTVVAYLKDAWCNYINVDVGLSSIETNARLLQAFGPQEIVVIVALDVVLPDFQGSITLCLPADGMEGVVDRFRVWHNKSKKEEDLERKHEKENIILDVIKRSNLQILAEFDNFQMGLDDVLALQVNDVITLNKKIDDTINIIIDGKTWYRGKLGKTKLKKSVKIVDIAVD